MPCYDYCSLCTVHSQKIYLGNRLHNRSGQPFPQLHLRDLSVVDCKAKCHKLSANRFVDVAAVESDEEEDKSDEEEDRLEEHIHRPQLVGRSGKQSYQQKIDAIIERLDRKTPEEATSIKLPKMLQLPKGIPLPPQKSIFVVDFFSGTFYKDAYGFVFLHYGFAQPVPEYSPSNLCR